ncbi:heparan-alpha-glucosaminide N-acetyltransferase domain-containing protein [Cytobacillus firmus]|uniref:heparan-alpha-glucosaminide N-acetyltransferase domain-containing protein n=1 Tax=Cytobacillus firmus TaxID=1399 RepID=UPI0024C1062B|nr:heparan-alpha-glucosaminide N-acetyltransferase domain-containing protein [Cytobacillus firmus]WHY61470.1 heparan-alpha-glucosaminide N-acetyltransferase domain-containing protein [Cytobacillus firmus]
MERALKETPKKRRFRSLDITRGLIVLLSVFLFHIPAGGYEYLRHARWYDITIMDYILPGFITVFGVGMAFAYHRGVNWSKLIKRTIRLIIYGLIFNMIVDWKVDLSTIRITGVLQLYGVLGLLAVIISTLVKSWRLLIPVVAFILLIHGYILFSFSQSCTGGLLQPDCNPSGIIDVAVFGAEHLYHQGTMGYDPEGFMTVIGALSNVLLGMIAGRILLEKRDKGAWKELILFGAAVLLLSYAASNFLPFNKKIWTPSFAMLTAGTVITVFAFIHLVFDQLKKTNKGILTWYIEAFGRNSFLIYFGKFIVYSFLARIMIDAGGKEVSFSAWLLSKMDQVTQYPQLAYAGVMLLAWSAVAIILHLKKWYVKA